LDAAEFGGTNPDGKQAGPRKSGRKGTLAALGGSGPAVVGGLAAGVAAGLIAWLAATADETERSRLARIPMIKVPVAGGAGSDAAKPILAPADSGPARPLPPRSVTRGRLLDTDAPIKLGQAPLAGLFEDSPAGPLPITGAEGKTSWQVYARPFPADDPRGRIAMIVTDLGSSSQATGTVIETLPGTVTLAFEPRVETIRKWIDAARDRGHEVILTVPMEPLDYPLSDPGPRTLLTFLPAEENATRLEWFLGRAPGVIGIISTTGSRFLQSNDDLPPILRLLHRRGLGFVDSRITLSAVASDAARKAGLPFAFVHRQIDRDPARTEIDSQLGELEKLALDTGVAVGLARPLPVTIERLTRWQKALNRDKLTLAPLSAVFDRFKPADAGEHGTDAGGAGSGDSGAGGSSGAKPAAPAHGH